MTNKQVESCFLYHNSSIHFCTDSLLMTRCGGLSLSIIIWRIGGGGKFPFAMGPKNSLGGPVHKEIHDYKTRDIILSRKSGLITCTIIVCYRKSYM